MNRSEIKPGGTILPHSNTPSLRVAGFENQDDDEDEYEAPCERGSLRLSRGIEHRGKWAFDVSAELCVGNVGEVS